MGVRFVMGRAGTGKRTRCFNAIARMLADDPLGPTIYWLLPQQATFTAERELTCAAGGPGYCRARVVSFEQLARDLMEECGGAAVPEITPIGRQMILGQLLRQNESRLRFFQKVARHPGLAAQIDSAIAEFESCGKDPDQLDPLLTGLAESGADFDAGTLVDKLHDLQLIYRAYTAFVGQDRFDPLRRMAHVLACAQSSKILPGATFYVDAFTEFDEFQRRLLARIASVCSHVEIALLMDPQSPVLAGATLDEMNLFHRIEQTYRKLRTTFLDERVAIDPPLFLNKPHRFKVPALAAIEQSLFSASHPVLDDADGIELLEAPDPRSEVDAAARRIKCLLNDGMRMRDIAVIVRRLDDYHDLINASFREHGIAYFVDRRRTMGHHPLLQFLRASLAIARRQWPRESVMTILKCGLGQISTTDADALENYVLQHRLHASAWTRDEPWTYGAPPPPAPEEFHDSLFPTGTPAAEPLPAPLTLPERMDLLRRSLAARLEKFALQFEHPRTTLPLRQIARAVFDLLDRFEIRQTLSKWITDARAAGRFEEADEHEQVWTELVGLFDLMVDLLGDQPATLDDFSQILESALETFDLALTPPTVDQVLVGQVDRTRTAAVRAVLVLGLNHGVFPFAPRESTLLSDLERTELQKRNFDVNPDTERRLLDEELLGYIAFTRASERLYISRVTSDSEQKSAAPSIFWRRLREMFPSLAPTQLPQDPRTRPDLIGTPRQLLTAVMRWVRAGGNTSPDQAWPALYQWLATHPSDNNPIDAMRYRVWPALSYRNAASLSPESTAALFASPLRADVRQLETFSECAFKHFVTSGLRLEQRPDDDPNALDLDRIYHKILEKIVEQMLRERAGWASLSPDKSRQLIDRFSREIAQSLRGEIMLSNARNQYLLDRIKSNLDRIIEAQKTVASLGQFQPAYAGLAFGHEHGLPALALDTPRGRHVEIHGHMDRVDALGEEAALAVIDYRLSGSSLNLGRVRNGLSLRLVTHLLVLQAHGEKLGGHKPSPAAAFFVGLLRKLESVEHPADANDPSSQEFHLGKNRPRGIVDATFAEDLDSTLGGEKALFLTGRKKDGNFGVKSDVKDRADFEDLLASVKQTLAGIADQIIDGKIEAEPYRIANTSPCERCDFRSVCRFDTAHNDYRFLSSSGSGDDDADRVGGVDD